MSSKQQYAVIQSLVNRAALGLYQTFAIEGVDDRQGFDENPNLWDAHYLEKLYDQRLMVRGSAFPLKGPIPVVHEPENTPKSMTSPTCTALESPNDRAPH